MLDGKADARSTALHFWEYETRRELFDLEADPAEKSDLALRQPAVADKLQADLRAWQASVLHSLTGADYVK